MTKISIIVPSLFPEALQRALAAIEATTHGIDYEVVVVSPFEVTHPKVRWVREVERRGVVPAHSLAFAHATGDFIVGLADDVPPVEDWAGYCLDNFERRERGHAPFVLGLLPHTRIICTVFGIYYANFPFARRAAIERLGYFRDCYHAHFGDVDFSLRVWEAGGRCEFSERPLIIAGPEAGPARDAGVTHRFRSYEKDLATFVARWGASYGKGWDTGHRDRFLLDLNPPTQLTVVNGNSVFVNNPRFRELYENFNANIGRVRVAMAFPE